MVFGSKAIFAVNRPLVAYVPQSPKSDRIETARVLLYCLADWFDGPPHIRLDEEIVGLGSFGHTLTVFSSDTLNEDPVEEGDDDERRLIESYAPRFAYCR